MAHSPLEQCFSTAGPRPGIPGPGSDPERLNYICIANVSDRDFIIPVTDN